MSLTNHQVTMENVEVQVLLHAFLPSAQNTDMWSVTRPVRFNTDERIQCTYWKAAKWVGPMSPTKSSATHMQN